MRLENPLDIQKIAIRVASGKVWYHVTPKKNLKSILKNGLIKGDSNYEEYKTGEGIYVSDNLSGAEWYVDNFDMPTVVLEISGLDESKMLMDEDQVANVFDEEFNEAFAGYESEDEEASTPGKYPNETAMIKDLVNGGMAFNDAVIKVIDERKLRPDPELAGDYQGGINALTARYVGRIGPEQIKVVKLERDQAD